MAEPDAHLPDPEEDPEGYERALSLTYALLYAPTEDRQGYDASAYTNPARATTHRPTRK